MKYKRKPIEIVEAFEFTGNPETAQEWAYSLGLNGRIGAGRWDSKDTIIQVDTGIWHNLKLSYVQAVKGDYLVNKGDKIIYVYKKGKFESKYEEMK